ncbi:hypothetical protein AX15_007304 [Amanita polypyramis BW_CC]|nr:hypothetical protein AX15_007304 [Amanita polypyramis BW_CC]
MLPSPDKLRTPLFFTTSELEAFKGTNIYGATLDRQREWQAEHVNCLDAISKSSAEWAALFTWERYVACATYLSSRAFPSSLLARNPSAAQFSSAEPILIPGLDILNHARGTAVTWNITYPLLDNLDTTRSQCEPSISLILHSAAIPHRELFNNYGPKPNSELIMGYGFSIPDNPDDTILLKIGGLNGQRWSVGRDARGIEGLWDEIVQSTASEKIPSYENQLDAADLLMEMCKALFDRLPQSDAGDKHDMRHEVRVMFEDYIEGTDFRRRHE